MSGMCFAQLPSNEEAGALDAKGAALAEAGKIGEAVEQFRRALLLAPGFPEARYHLGLAYDRLGQTDEAMAEFEAALGLRADFLQARYLLAGCCRKRGDFEGEMRLLAGIVQAAPAFSEARFNYGLALQLIEKPVQAIEQLRAAVLGDPRSSRYLLALGIALSGPESGRGSCVFAARRPTVPWRGRATLQSGAGDGRRRGQCRRDWRVRNCHPPGTGSRWGATRAGNRSHAGRPAYGSRRRASPRL